MDPTGLKIWSEVLRQRHSTSILWIKEAGLEGVGRGWGRDGIV